MAMTSADMQQCFAQINKGQAITVPIPSTDGPGEQLMLCTSAKDVVDAYVRNLANMSKGMRK